jgi:hypothetical protein
MTQATVPRDGDGESQTRKAWRENTHCGVRGRLTRVSDRHPLLRGPQRWCARTQTCRTGRTETQIHGTVCLARVTAPTASEHYARRSRARRVDHSAASTRSGFHQLGRRRRRHPDEREPQLAENSRLVSCTGRRSDRHSRRRGSATTPRVCRHSVAMANEDTVRPEEKAYVTLRACPG